MNQVLKNLDAFAIKAGWQVKQASNCLRIYERKKPFPSKTVVRRIYIRGTQVNGWPAMVDVAEYQCNKRIKSNTKDIAGLGEIKKIIKAKDNAGSVKITRCSFDERYMK